MYSKPFTCTHGYLWAVHYSLKGMQMHMIAFRGCSILTKMHSIAFRRCSILTHKYSHVLNCIQGLFNSHTNAIFLMVTPRWVAFNNDLMAFIHTQWMFTLTPWCSCARNGCSGAVPTHLLAFMSIHSMGVQRGVQYSLKGFQPVHI